jgi:putative nucleotidyltransferase with HDIG domain
VEIVDRARRLAEQKLANALPQRWVHVQAVAGKAARASIVLPTTDRAVAVAAAWLHDIGYSPTLVQTGFHPLDGARWLREHGFDARIASLVAHHSCALLEADARGLADALASEFPGEESPVSDVLWYADMTTGPEGQDFDVHERLAEIRDRYGPDDVVTRFWTYAMPVAVAAVRRTEARLVAAGQPM